jgi:hypothetical protein
MPTCNWSLLCPGATTPDEGALHAEKDAQLAVTFESAGKVTVGEGDDGKTLAVEGDLTLKKIGDRDVRFVGAAGFDISGVTSLSGKLVFDLSKNVSVEVNGQMNPQTGDMRAGGMLTIVF